MMLVTLHRLALTSYAALILTVTIWYFVFDPPAFVFSTALRLVYLMLLLLPLKALLQRSVRVYLWSSYLMLVFFAHGIIEAYANSDYHLFAVLEIIFSLAYFSVATLCTRAVRRQKDSSG